MNVDTLIKALIGLAGTVIVLVMTVGINDAGNRVVVQYPSGKLFVKFEPGLYTKWFGSATEYRDIITFDYDKKGQTLLTSNESSLEQNGITVRYQDGGVGVIYGKARFALPNDEPSMLKLHKAFRSNSGVASKLIKTVTEEGTNLTAGLMSSEEAYAEKRGIFTQWSSAQIKSGKFQTKLDTVYAVDESTGNRVEKTVPVISYGKDGLPIHLKSDLKEYGVSVTGFQITDWDFEAKTLNQISAKREATMAIITAKANAERAKQDAITAEEQGKANVMTAKYQKEVEKEQAVVEAEKAKEVALIKAKQLVGVAEQKKLEAEQKKLAAVQYKQEQVLRGEGDSEYKRLVMQADGALQQKLDTYVKVQNRFAQAIEKQKWVPEIQMGASKDSTGSPAMALIDMLNVKTAKDLALDMSMKNSVKTDKQGK